MTDRLTSSTRILVTGAAGFIGYHLSERLAGDGLTVLGLDNLSPYYDVTLKQARLDRLARHGNFRFCRADLADGKSVEAAFDGFSPHIVVNLAAQAGVRYSLDHPHTYIDSNVMGFLNILEACRHGDVDHLVYASTSSVYGANTAMPFSVHQPADHPVSLYAASKKANEAMAHAYSHLYGIASTGLRFFTVYGPWGRPDMALFLFTDAILSGRAIDVFNNGHMRRDFTYIDDIVEGMVRVMAKAPQGDPQWNGDHPDPPSSSAPHRLYNIGNSQPVELLDMIESLERCLGKTAKKNMLPMQPGDVPATYADMGDLERDFGYAPKTPLDQGIRHFVDWYLDFYKKK